MNKNQIKEMISEIVDHIDEDKIVDHIDKDKWKQFFDKSCQENISKEEDLAEVDDYEEPDENALWKQWKTEAWQVTAETFPAFIEKLAKYPHGYGTIVNAMAAGAVAACVVLDKSEPGGITGFQAGIIFWRFFECWMRLDEDDVGRKMVDYNRILYPQYKDEFTLSIPENTWRKIQNKAAKLLFSKRDLGVTNPDVIKHWKSIVSGIVPFDGKVR